MILPALQSAANRFLEEGEGRVRRLVLITDAAVGNESQVLGEFAGGLGEVRLHVLGIGFAPNRYLVRKLARFGHGRCAFVADPASDSGAVDRFLRSIDRPVMSGLDLAWEGDGSVVMYPSSISDLHAGETLLVAAKLPAGADGRFVLTGRVRGRSLRETIPLAAAEPSFGASVRWARHCVEDLMDSLHGGADERLVRERVVDLGRTFHLVTRFTSLVAEEEFPTVTGGSRSLAVPNGLPHGSRMSVGGVGMLPQGGTDAPLRRLLGLILAAAGLAGTALAGRSRS